MTQHHRSILRRHALVLIVPGALLATGCSAEREPETPAFEADQSYTDIQGTIAVMPDPARPIDGFAIRHGHIPEFRGEDGEIYINTDGTPGMKAMTMDFNNLAPGITIDQFEVGDAVVFGFEVDWSHPIRYRIHEIAPETDTQQSGPETAEGGEGTSGG